MTLIELLTLTSTTIACLSLVLLYRQVKTASLALKKDHLRREREATFDYLEKNFPIINEYYWMIKEKYGDERVWSSNTISEIEEDQEYKKALNAMLDRIEVLSLGVHNGIYSFDVVYDYAELQLSRMHEQLWPIVKYWENKHQRDNLFTHFQSLISRIHERHSSSSPVENN